MPSVTYRWTWIGGSLLLSLGGAVLAIAAVVAPNIPQWLRWVAGAFAVAALAAGWIIRFQLRRQRSAPEVPVECRRERQRAAGDVAAMLAMLPLVVIAWMGFNSGKKVDQAPTFAAAVTMPDHSDGRYGIDQPAVACIDEADLSRFNRYMIDNDADLAKSETLRAMTEGRCTVLMPGERVILTKAGFALNKVRRPGETADYWVPRERVR